MNEDLYRGLMRSLGELLPALDRMRPFIETFVAHRKGCEQCDAAVLTGGATPPCRFGATLAARIANAAEDPSQGTGAARLLGWFRRRAGRHR